MILVPTGKQTKIVIFIWIEGNWKGTRLSSLIRPFTKCPQDFGNFLEIPDAIIALALWCLKVSKTISKTPPCLILAPFFAAALCLFLLAAPDCFLIGILCPTKFPTYIVNFGCYSNIIIFSFLLWKWHLYIAIWMGKK